MSKKSKHGRGRHPHFRKRMKQRQEQHIQSGTGVGQPTASSDTTMAATSSDVTPSVSHQAPQAPIQKKTPSLAAIPLHYEFIGSDLKRIGILTAIVIIILIIFYVFLK